MKCFMLMCLLSLPAFSQSINYDSRRPETKEEQQAFEEWNREEEEAREREEKERFLLEERARGYEPTSDEYKPADNLPAQ